MIRFTRVLVLLCISFAAGKIAMARSVLTVAPNLGECAAQFTRIQDAIAAAPSGSSIFVCPGVYNEQLRISKPLMIKFGTGTFVRTVGVQPTGVSFSSGVPFVAVVFVTDTEGVEIEGGQFDGSQAGIASCAPRFFGIVFQNASGEIRRPSVTNIRLSDVLSGCQSGTAILVQSGNGGTSRVKVEGTKLSGYQKNGITADGEGTYVEVKWNKALGDGPVTGAAQNGIQIGFGATGVIFENVTTGHQWAPCISTSQCEFFATGILVVDAPGVKVFGNHSGQNQENLVLGGTDNIAQNNYLFDSKLLDGLMILGEGSRVKHNLIATAGRSGAFVDANNATVDDNTFIDMPIGILKLAGVIGLDHEHNRFINVEQEFVDPSPQTTPRPSPDRP
jgi:hypothetical protein